jgi:hypothetical protein
LADIDDGADAADGIPESYGSILIYIKTSEQEANLSEIPFG